MLKSRDILSCSQIRTLRSPHSFFIQHRWLNAQCDLKDFSSCIWHRRFSSTLLRKNSLWDSHWRCSWAKRFECRIYDRLGATGCKCTFGLCRCGFYLQCLLTPVTLFLRILQPRQSLRLNLSVHLVLWSRCCHVLPLCLIRPFCRFRVFGPNSRPWSGGIPGPKGQSSHGKSSVCSRKDLHSTTHNNFSCWWTEPFYCSSDNYPPAYYTVSSDTPTNSND